MFEVDIKQGKVSKILIWHTQASNFQKGKKLLETIKKNLLKEDT